MCHTQNPREISRLEPPLIMSSPCGNGLIRNFVIVRLLLNYQPVPKLEVALVLADKHRSFMRDPGEPLQKSLARLSESGGRQQPATPARLLKADGEPLRVTEVARNAWQTASVLEIGESCFQVLYDPAEVVSLEAPVNPIMGVPIVLLVKDRRPSAASLDSPGGGASSLDFFWERSRKRALGTDIEWEPLSRLGRYTPGPNDVGSEIRVTARPPGQNVPALLGRTVHLGKVRAPLARPVLARRLNAFEKMAKQTALTKARRSRKAVPSAAFRLVSYNMLADSYRRYWDAPGNIHDHCSPEITDPRNRLSILLRELLATGGDLFCLQEVDVVWANRFWLPQLKAAGYDAVLTPKGSEAKGFTEGLLIAARRDNFVLESVEVVALNSTLGGTAAPQRYLRRHAQTAASMASMPTVAQVATLRERHYRRRHLVVANAHLYFAAPAVHVRLLQVGAILERLEAEVNRLRAAGETVASVVAGDLNSDRTDAVLRLLQQGSVGADDSDWTYGELMWRGSLGQAASYPVEAMVAAIGSEREGGKGGEGSALAGGASALGDAEAATRGSAELAEARAIALRFQRLRGSLRTLLGEQKRSEQKSTDALDDAEALEADQMGSNPLPEVPTTPSAEAHAAEGTTSVAAAAAREESIRKLAARDAELGKSLVASAALAAIELSEQAGVALDAAGSSDGLQAGLEHLQRLGSELEEAMQKVASSTRAGGGVGETLSHTLPLRSAYGDNAQPTHALPQYQNTLDWVLYDALHLRLGAAAPLPTREEMLATGGMPSAEFPSDHVSLLVELYWAEEGAGLEECAEVEGSRRSLAVAVAPCQLTNGAVAESMRGIAAGAAAAGNKGGAEAWMSEWRARIDSWWAALPIGLSGELRTCAAFLSGLFAARFESWLLLKRLSGAATPPTPPRRDRHNEQCEALMDKVEDPFPDFPEPPYASFWREILPLMLAPIPRLLPRGVPWGLSKQEAAEVEQTLAAAVPNGRFNRALVVGAAAGMGLAAASCWGLKPFRRTFYRASHMRGQVRLRRYSLER